MRLTYGYRGGSDDGDRAAGSRRWHRRRRHEVVAEPDMGRSRACLGGGPRIAAGRASPDRTPAHSFPRYTAGCVTWGSAVDRPSRRQCGNCGLLAVEQHDADVAVHDESGRFMGAIPIGWLLALLHEEHVDDILRMGGLAAFHPATPEMGGIAQMKPICRRLLRRQC